MKIKTIFLSVILILSISPVFADELNDLKLEVQKLKEKVTELNNANPAMVAKKWGRSFSIGFPVVGLYNEDFIVGLDFTYPVLKYLSLRLDAHFLFDFTRRQRLRGFNIETRRMFNPVLLPSLGAMGTSPMIFNTRVYGGFFFGIAYDIKNKYGPYFQFKGLGGVEIFITKHRVFFIEAGGGSALFPHKNKDFNFMDYTGGVIITAGSRYYL